MSGRMGCLILSLCVLQKNTIIVLNASLLGCIVCLTFLLFVSIQQAPALFIHICFILALAIGLLILINW